jgi:hypothetical protein
MIQVSCRTAMLTGVLTFSLVSCSFSRVHQSPPSSSISETSVAKAVAADFIQGDSSALAGFLDPTVAAQLTPSVVQQYQTELRQKLGKFQKIVGTRVGKIAPYDVVYVTCRFATGPIDVKVVFDAAHKVAGLFFVKPGQN